MSQFIPLKSYAQFFPPGVPEENVTINSSWIQNTGNEYLLMSGYTVFVKVNDGTYPSISYDYSYGILKNTLPLGMDFTGGGAQHIVADIEDPDVSGAFDLNNPNKARFIAVYKGFDLNNPSIKMWFEVWELDPNATPVFDQKVAPTPMTSAAITDIYSPNVDVSHIGEVAVVYNFNGTARLKLAQSLFSLGTDLDASLHDGLPINGSTCKYSKDITWVDVSVTNSDPASVCGNNARVNVVYNYALNNQVAVMGGNFNPLHFAHINNPQFVCGADFDFQINAAAYTGFPGPFGPPRITGLSKNLGLTTLKCGEYAITYAGIIDPAVGYDHIYMQHGNKNAILFNDNVNYGPNTHRCYNGNPAIGYDTDSHILTVVWEFFDCNYCIPGNTECNPSDPASTQNKPGYYILGRTYDNTGARLYPGDISVISDPNYAYPDARRPSISGRHSEMPTEMLFSYTDNNIQNHVYKASNVTFSNLKMPLGLNNTIKSEQSFSAYPNPFYEELNLQFDFRDSDLQLNIYDVSGKLVKQQYLPDVPTNQHKINTAMLNKGIYLLEIKTKQKVFNQKITKL